MLNGTDCSHSKDTTFGLTSSGKIFRSFHHWSAVPVSDLLRLRHALGRAPAVTSATHALLQLVDAELARRSSSLGGIIPPPPQDHPPEAG
ncbi:hypothetical protein FDW83_09605 [Pseudarthrobacter sp. NamE2]|nr:hypothetical protein FDW83_09605 [Pseudarthrobacter sp. NamE2]